MELSDYRTYVDDVKNAAHKFYNLKYQMSNGGNLSIRIPGLPYMIVKGTDVAFDEVSEHTLVITDFSGNMIAGAGKPSKEALLHGVIYQSQAEVNAIMHCHSPYATAWAAEHEELYMATHHARLKLQGMVPVFDTHSYAVPKEFFPGIMQFFQQNPGASGFLLRGHGQLTVGKTMREACHLAELIEETAQIALLSMLRK